MCMRCDGYSWEEIDRHTDLVIRVHGFLIQQVDAELPWTYTIGVRESWNRPELLMVDLEAGVQSRLVSLVAGDYLAHGEVLASTLDVLDVELGPVDGSHFQEGLVAAWEHRYSMSAHTGDFHQIIPGRSWSRAGAARRRLGSSEDSASA